MRPIWRRWRSGRPIRRLRSDSRIAAVAATAGLYARLAGGKADRATALVRELPAHYLALTCTVFRVLPLVLMAPLALREPRLWIAAAIPAVNLAGDSRKFIRYTYSG